MREFRDASSAGRERVQRFRKRSTLARRSGVSNDSVSDAIAKSIVASTARSSVQVEHALGRLDRLPRQRGDLVRGGERGGRAPRRRGTRGWRARSRRRAGAVMRSPVNAYSFASSRLVCSGQVSGPPSAATSPTVTCGSERYADSAMYTTSESAITLQPSPTAGPFTAATTGHAAADHVEHELAALGDRRRAAARGRSPSGRAGRSRRRPRTPGPRR